MWTPFKVDGAGFGPPRTPPVEGQGWAGIAQTAGLIKTTLTAAVAAVPIRLARILQDSGSVRDGDDALDGGIRWTNVTCVV